MPASTSKIKDGLSANKLESQEQGLELLNSIVAELQSAQVEKLIKNTTKIVDDDPDLLKKLSNYKAITKETASADLFPKLKDFMLKYADFSEKYKQEYQNKDVELALKQPNSHWVVLSDKQDEIIGFLLLTQQKNSISLLNVVCNPAILDINEFVKDTIKDKENCRFRLLMAFLLKTTLGLLVSKKVLAAENNLLFLPKEAEKEFYKEIGFEEFFKKTSKENKEKERNKVEEEDNIVRDVIAPLIGASFIGAFFAGVLWKKHAHGDEQSREVLQFNNRTKAKL